MRFRIDINDRAAETSHTHTVSCRYRLRYRQLPHGLAASRGHQREADVANARAVLAK